VQERTVTAVAEDSSIAAYSDDDARAAMTAVFPTGFLRVLYYVRLSTLLFVYTLPLLYTWL